MYRKTKGSYSILATPDYQPQGTAFWNRYFCIITFNQKQSVPMSPYATLPLIMLT